jgi:hypothetical protein
MNWIGSRTAHKAVKLVASTGQDFLTGRQHQTLKKTAGPTKRVREGGESEGKLKRGGGLERERDSFHLPPPPPIPTYIHFRP